MCKNGILSVRSKIKACRDIPTGNYCRIIPHSNMQGSSVALTPPTESWYSWVSIGGLNASSYTLARSGVVPLSSVVAVGGTWRTPSRQRTKSGRRHLMGGPSRTEWSARPWRGGLAGKSPRDWTGRRVFWKIEEKFHEYVNKLFIQFQSNWCN